MERKKFDHKNTQHGSSIQVLQKYRKEFGFTGVLNTHMMVIFTSNLKPSEKVVLLWIIHNTIGWNRLETYFDIDDWYVKINGVSKTLLYKVLGTLEGMNIIERSKKRRHNKSSGILWFQPDHRFWNITYDNELVSGVIPENYDGQDGETTTDLSEDETNELLKDL